MPHPQPPGQIRGVVERALRGVFRRQHHAAHVLGAKRIGGDRGDQRRVDPARQAQHHLPEAALAEVVAKARRNGVIVLFPGVGDRGRGAPDDAPALGPAREVDVNHRGLEIRQLEGQRAVGVQPEARAVEHLVVLPAHHVEIDQRQPGLVHSRADHRTPDLLLVAVIGRAVRHQQKLGAAFRLRLGDVRAPRVLADRRADADRADPDRAGDGALVVVPEFVEDLDVRQRMLEGLRHDPAAHEDVIGVEELAVRRPPRTADPQRRPVGAVPRQILHCGHGISDEGALPHQILDLVAGHEHLGQGDQPGAGVAALRPGFAGLGRILADRADARIELGKGDAESIVHAVVHAVVQCGPRLLPRP